MHPAIKYKGDGKKLYDAVRVSSLRTNDFFKALGISRGTLYNYYDSEDLDFSIKNAACKILGRSIEDVFKQQYIDAGRFLIEEEQLNTDYKRAVVKSQTEKTSKELIPYYDVDIIAGIQQLFDDKNNTVPAYYLDIPEYYGCVAFPVYADSMDPLITSGCTIFCRHIANWYDILEYGQIYAVQLKDLRRFIKYIRKSKNPSNFIMRSHNQLEYDDFEVPKSEITHIWLVEGWMRRKTQ